MGIAEPHDEGPSTRGTCPRLRAPEKGDDDQGDIEPKMFTTAF